METWTKVMAGNSNAHSPAYPTKIGRSMTISHISRSG